MEFLKTWLVPPIIGAIIGYFTNWLAIKMLFRPLNPIYIGRFKLPFTPGILPRERRRLTDSVGETVSKELLTGEVFRGRLEDPALKERIDEAVYVIVAEALQKDASAFLHSLSEKIEASRTLRDNGFSQAESLVLESLKTVLGSTEIKEAFVFALTLAVDDIEALPLKKIISPKTLEAIASRFTVSLGSAERQEQIGNVIAAGGKAESAATGLLSLELKKEILEFGVKALYSRLVPVLEAVLASPEMKAQLNGLGVSILKKAIGRLGPIQRLIVSAANYERTLTETMPETVQDITQTLVRLLKEQKTADNLVLSVHRYLFNPRLRSQDGAVAEEASTAGELRQALQILMNGLSAEGKDFAARLAQGYEPIADLSLGELLPGLSAGFTSSLAALLLGKDIKEVNPNMNQETITGSAMFSKALESFLTAYAEKLEGRSLAEVLCLSETQKRALASRIAKGAVAGISSYTERLVDALDIRQMVMNKIDSLDMAEAERILLQVVKRELNWITILGGVLGLIIGFSQSLLSLL
jgi:uncharacterized membrane protein YheB (UPF0754 family)